jgi:hypothetical protein
MMPGSRSSPEQAGAASEFARLISACLRRFLAQNGKPAAPEAELAGLTARFWHAVSREASTAPAGGLEWREIPPERIEALVGEIMDDSMASEFRADLSVPVRQLLKACLQAEPVRCRESYREVVGGRCRRQELDRARGRISGAHCVDCPHWVALDAAKNTALMERAWVEGPVSGFQAHRDFFLPEDFRALRIWARRVTIRSV